MHRHYPELKEKIIVDDFSQGINFFGNFDIILDRGAVTCNTEDGIRKALKFAYDKLENDGVFIGLDLYSTRSDCFSLGEATESFYLKKNFQFISNGSAQNSIGNLHFFDLEKLLNLFSAFDIKKVEEKIVNEMIPNKTVFAVWNVIAQKNGSR